MVTILGGGYAIVHKWNHNRNRMHYHIDTFIKRENESLKDTRTSLGKVLEIGTGSGYQAAVLSQLVAEVYSIEIVAPAVAESVSSFTAAGSPAR